MPNKKTFLDDERTKKASELSFFASKLLKTGRKEDAEKARKMFAEAADLAEAVYLEIPEDSPRIRAIFSEDIMMLRLSAEGKRT